MREFENMLLKIFSLNKMRICIPYSTPSLLSNTQDSFATLVLLKISLRLENLYVKVSDSFELKLEALAEKKQQTECLTGHSKYFLSEVKVNNVPELREELLAVETLFGVLCLSCRNTASCLRQTTNSPRAQKIAEKSTKFHRDGFCNIRRVVGSRRLHIGENGEVGK